MKVLPCLVDIDLAYNKFEGRSVGWLVRQHTFVYILLTYSLIYALTLPPRTSSPVSFHMHLCSKELSRAVLSPPQYCDSTLASTDWITLTVSVPICHCKISWFKTIHFVFWVSTLIFSDILHTPKLNFTIRNNPNYSKEV